MIDLIPLALACEGATLDSDPRRLKLWAAALSLSPKSRGLVGGEVIEDVAEPRDWLRFLILALTVLPSLAEMLPDFLW